MSLDNNFDERIIAKLLSQHAERGVSASVDLWPEVKKRLAQRESTPEFSIEEPGERKRFDWLLGGGRWPAQQASTQGRSASKPYRYTGALAGLLGVIALTAIVMLSISGLAQHPAKNDKNPQDVPTPSLVSSTPSVIPSATAIPEIPPPVATVYITYPPGAHDEPTLTPLPTLPPLRLVRDRDNYQLEGVQREYMSTRWVSPSQFMVSHSNPSDPNGYKDTFLVHLDTAQVQQLDAMEAFRSTTNLEGTYGLALLNDKDTGRPMGVDLLDLTSGKIEKLLDVDPAAAQLASADDRKWAFGDIGDISSEISARWVDANTYLLTRTPLGDGKNTVQAWPGWGKVLIGNVKTSSLRTLTERGQVAAILPDGSLLVRQGWIDGELQLLTPPYTGTPKKVAPSGPWTDLWAVSPDSNKVAWIEMTPPPTGDWSLRLPDTFMSSDPQPDVHSIGVWDRISGQVKRLSVQGMIWQSWLDTNWIHWRKDDSALLYTIYSYTGKADAKLYSLSLDGKSKLLTDNTTNIYGVRAEGEDGSLYLETVGDLQRVKQLVRLSPGGQLQVVCERYGAETSDCYADEHGRLVNLQSGEISIEDLNSGTTRRATVPQYSSGSEWGPIAVNDAILSPDSRWAAFFDHVPGVFHFVRTR